MFCFCVAFVTLAAGRLSEKIISIFYAISLLEINLSRNFRSTYPLYRSRTSQINVNVGCHGRIIIEEDQTTVEPNLRSGTSYGHKLTECPRFRSASPGARLEMLQHFEGCRNCLYVGHRTNACPSPFSCRWCNMRHHSDLHLPTQPAAPTGAPPGNQRPNSPSTSGFAGASTDQRSGVLLGTVVAAICDAHGQQRTFRGVLDPGSQFSFITEDCARKLTLTAKPFRGAIAGVNQSPLCHVKGIVSVGFVSPLAETFQTEAIVVPSITPPLPQVALRSTRWEEYRAYPLSDTRFDEPGPISFLIGADLYPEIVIGRPIALFDASPRLIETVFGFTIIGRFYEDAHPHGAVALMAQTDLKTLVERFWQLEEPSTPGSLEEEPCEEFFLQTHYRTGDGRYVVRLPFKTANPPINPNINRVLNCFRSLENRLAKDEFLRREYSDQMSEYLHLGHMRPASGPPRYVLPHHAVVKEMGEQRKVRVVFDASFPSSSGSLNDHLLTGPKLQADLADILLNFRRFPFVFTCDIVKMFRQILVDPADRPYLQIAWRFAAHEPVSMYELTTVTFGLSCSPYLAQRVLRQHATNYQRQYPEAAAVILQNTYIDDITGGADSVEELCRLKIQLVELLLKGGFELSKWGSNHPSLLADDLTAGGAISWGPADLQTTKILGMKWEPQSDVFSYDIRSPPQSSTKRSILSVIARLYDPLGYLAPVIFLAKSIFQHTWRADTTWDSEVPSEIKTVWLRFIGQLPSLSAISIPRPLPRSSEPPMLVGFCDASALGYCAAAYLRTASTTGTRLTLLRAKTRLAPIKTLTIPRLELCGALLLGQLIASLSRLRHELDVQQVFCFTDSMTVLAWLKSPTHRLQVFVANRVQQVLMVTDADWWYHVQGSENPADVGSRGISPERLREHHLWWTGPSWALQPLDEWPISDSVEISELPETKPSALTLNVTLVRPHLIDMAARHSKYPRMIRSMAYANRFIWNTRALRTNQARRSGAITAAEFQTAETTYVRVLQRFYYAEFYGKPFNELPLELRRLNAFLDESDIIRVGGRLRNASISFEQKHPILLPKHSAFTRLVIDYYHLQNHHAGPATIIAAIQLRYWIPGVRNTIKTVKRKCATCARFSRSSVIPFMGDLPKSRFAGVRAFLITGVDFAGPFIHKLSKLRNARTEKAYLCLFICMSSRAVHLEVATGLSVEAFLDAFDRFVWRRGLPQEMLSDGGTNFRGADNYLRELAKTLNSPVAQDQLMDRTAPRGVKWNFNPPSSPHFGGGWEVAIRMVKELLNKTFGAQAYTLPELMTAFTKIEGIINSRPLQPLSADPEDLEPLTPGHFLVGQPLTSLPEPNYQRIPTNRLNRWQRVQERVQYFWGRWQAEYLASLQLRAKWDRHAPNLRVGDLVLIRDTAAPPAQWPLGRIQEVHPGSDDIVRVVTVRTSGGTYRRPAVKMIPLRLGDLHE
ncbi:unnamed protein product [Nesidiocoris tenuis]|uniref:Integrase catalytic domain-containing protein n=1 Tax=Nesidiocoris tenuis TaxID=355587 RepID=A0A6H5GTQ2_9HEMI|nr:unnamed protein product [Nesidiocoris tenuis]